MTNNGPASSPIRKYDIRCICNRLLMRAYLAPGSEVEIRCPKCGYLFKHARRMPPDGFGRHEESEEANKKGLINERETS
jgi:phage FluMu protein Com